MDTKTKLVTYDDYQNLPDDGNRYEIMGGELFMTPAPSTNHQRISRKLLIALNNYVEREGIGEVFDAPIDVVLSMTDVVQPDLLFVSKEREHIITKKNIVAAPDLVAEIISEHTETIDRTRKKDLYAQYGVKEYWLVYPEEKQIERYTLAGEAFELTGTIAGQDSLTSEIMDGFSIQLDEIFGG